MGSGRHRSTPPTTRPTESHLLDRIQGFGGLPRLQVELADDPGELAGGFGAVCRSGLDTSRRSFSIRSPQGASRASANRALDMLSAGGQTDVVSGGTGERTDLGLQVGGVGDGLPILEDGSQGRLQLPGRAKCGIAEHKSRRPTRSPIHPRGRARRGSAHRRDRVPPVADPRRVRGPTVHVHVPWRAERVRAFR